MYTTFSAGDNFCRVCRTNLRGVVRGRGGLYQQINRVPSPHQVLSPPREQPPDNDDGMGSDDEQNRHSDSDQEDQAHENVLQRGGGGGGFLRIAVLEDE